jgi:hypothetical protein
MIAIAAPQAFAVLTDHGLSPESAMQALGRIKPCASYGGAPYYSPARVYRAAKRGKGRA